MSPPALFRSEALAARDEQWLGTIRIAQPPARHLAAVGALAVIALVVGFAIGGSYTRRATVPGFLEPSAGSLRLSAPAVGLVVEARASEGARVAAGDVLYTLSGDRRSTSGLTEALIGDQLAARRLALDADRRRSDERHRGRTRAARERLSAIDAELARLEREASINRARASIAARNVERFDALEKTGFVAPLQTQARVDDALVLAAQAENYERLRASLVRERVGLASQIDESRLQAEAERADLERTRTALDREAAENDAHRTTVVTAPFAARVTGLSARPGQWVGPGSLLATLIPADAPLEGRLFATTRQVGFVAAGQRVHLRYAAFPYQKFGVGTGTVRLVEASPYAPQELPAQVAATLASSGLPTQEPVYRIVVALDAQAIEVAGETRPLAAGMAFEADIVQDRRRLYEWWLEPLFAMTAR